MKRVAVLLVIAGLLIAGYPLAERAYTWYWQQQILSAWEAEEPSGGRLLATADPKMLQADEAGAWETQGPPPVGILTIDKIDLELPILSGTDSAALRIGAGLWEEGAAIGEEGNTVLTAHRVHTYGRLFNRLNEVERGDEIVIETRSGQYRFTVYDREIVRAQDLTLARAGEGEAILTLVTCHPLNRVNSPDRLVVEAHAAGFPADASVDGSVEE